MASPAFSYEEIHGCWQLHYGPSMVRKVRIRPVESGVGKILSGVGAAKPSQALEQTHLIGASDLQRWVAPCWNMASCLSTRRNWHNSIACIPLSASWNIVFKVMIPSQWGQTLSKHLKFTCNPNCGYTVWIEFQSLEGNMKIHEHIPGCMGEGNQKKTQKKNKAVVLGGSVWLRPV